MFAGLAVGVILTFLTALLRYLQTRQYPRFFRSEKKHIHMNTLSRLSDTIHYILYYNERVKPSGNKILLSVITGFICSFLIFTFSGYEVVGEIAKTVPSGLEYTIYAEFTAIYFTIIIVLLAVGFSICAFEDLVRNKYSIMGTKIMTLQVTFTIGLTFGTTLLGVTYYIANIGLHSKHPIFASGLLAGGLIFCLLNCLIQNTHETALIVKTYENNKHKFRNHEISIDLCGKEIKGYLYGVKMNLVVKRYDGALREIDWHDISAIELTNKAEVGEEHD